MNPTRALIAAAMVVLLLVWGVWRAGPSPNPVIPAGNPSRTPAQGGGSIDNATLPLVAEASATFMIDPSADPLEGLVGEGLNHPSGDALRDLRIVEDVLDAWRTNFPGTGNPVGLNFEITQALAGANPLRLAFVPSDHPAINPQGELCDRWGSPLVFHQISGNHMELRSAGPDRTPYTADDLVWNESTEP